MFKKDNQWTKIVDERTEENYNYHYNYTIPLERSVTSKLFIIVMFFLFY